MASGKKTTKKTTLRGEIALTTRLSKKHFQDKIKRHANDAKEKKERDETMRLSTREKMTNALIPIAVEAMYGRGTGLRMDANRLIKILDELTKQVCKILNIEPSGKKKEE